MRKYLKTLERLAVAVGIGLLFFAGLETVRAYETLAALHPVAGYAFVALVIALLAYVLWQLRALVSFRVALTPPELPERGPVSAKQAKRFREHMGQVCDRFEANPLFQEKHAGSLSSLRTAAGLIPEPDATGDNVRETVARVEREHVAPLLKILDREAEAVVSDNVGLVSVGTALSPYRSLDVYIVLARNARMVNRILHIYRTRPSPRETALVFYDIARVVAAVNLLNAMDNVWAGLGRHVPFLGRYGEVMSEGLFSGLLTSVTGHAAIDRCRSYRSWSKEEAVRTYRGKLHRWAKDVFGILKRHGIERLFGRGKGPQPEEQAEQSGADGDEGKSRWNPFTRKKGGDE
ncbi:MAG: hypothetical protein MAG453_00946 [Calditrichaeota bacterium]|nr:hypothetical protein [Calditrichota bacterium]